MQFHQDLNLAHYTIRSYGPGRVTVVVPQAAAGGPGKDRSHDRSGLQEEILTRSAVIMPQRLIKDWPPQRLAEIARAHFEVIAELAPEIVLLGSGRQLRFPDPTLLAPLSERGVGVEVMDTGAACRTYNILMAEGRTVAAVLLMIEAE